MKYVIAVYLSLLAVACGQVASFGVHTTGTMNVTGGATVTVKIDPSAIEDLFQSYCQELLSSQGIETPSGAQLQTCADTMTADFLAKLDSGKTVPVSVRR